MSGLLKTITRFFVLFLLVGLLSAPLASPALAQGETIPEATQVADEPLRELNVGGIEVSEESIQAAIKAPTPNLANTTAYIYYTIHVMNKALFDPEPNALSSGPAKNVSEAVEQNGLPGGIGFLMGAMIKNPPASGQTYLAYTIQNSKFAPQPVYAQVAPGLGFGALNPVLGTWVAFRNVAYYLLAIMFFVTGFLVIIRHKISGNVAVTVQSALPRLVITLILITFSYAIAGFVVDIMFLTLYFIVNLFSTQIFEPNALFFDDYGPGKLAFDTHIFKFFLDYIFAGDGGAWGAATALGDLVTSAVSSAFGGIIGGDGAVRDLLSNIISIIFVIIFGIALLIAMFKTFFSLLMSYAGFVINVVMSPLLLLQGVLPGQNAFEKWLRNILAGLAPFVVCVFMIFMSLALTGSRTRDGIGYDRDAPDQDGLRLPLILTDEIRADAFIGILGMGFMLLLPQAVDMSKKMFKAEGGVFDKYKDAAMKSFQEGWKGNKFVPGARQIVPGAMAGMAATGAALVGGGAYGGGKIGASIGGRFGATGAKVGRTIGAVGGGALGTAATVAGVPVIGAAAGGTLAAGGVMGGKLFKPAQNAYSLANTAFEAIDRTSQRRGAIGTEKDAASKSGATGTIPSIQGMPEFVSKNSGSGNISGSNRA